MGDPPDAAARGRRVRLERMARARDVDMRRVALKHGILVAGLALLAAVRDSAWVLLYPPAYIGLDLLRNWTLRRAMESAEVGATTFRLIVAQHWLWIATFTALAVWIASEDSYVSQLAAFVLLMAQALHSVSIDSNSEDYAIADVVVVAVGFQLVVWHGSGWATPGEQLFLHLALFLMVAFMVQAMLQNFQAIRTLERTASRLRRAQRSGVVGQLASGIAHDFNNLLTVMRGNLELIREVPEHERPALLQEIETAAKRGGQLVSRLSTAGRGEATVFEAVPLRPVIESCERMARSTLPANVRLRVDLRDAPFTVAADPAQLELALLNLVVNARDALPLGGTILLRAAPGEANRVRITVSDDGEGMTPEVLARATEAYETTKPPGKGTGLGLAMVKAFVDDAGGTLRFDSTPGAGTEVEIVLPAAPGVARAFAAA